MKKFYTLATTHKTNDGYEIHLDEKPVKTALKNTLVSPNEALANHIVQEWMTQQDTINPETMPLTTLLNTKIDRIGADRDAMTATILKYLDTDLVCYRASEPPAMKTAQESAWNPVCDWFSGQYGSTLKMTETLAAVAHDRAAHNAVHDDVAAMDDDHFTVLQSVVADSGSLVLALMFVHGNIDAQGVYDCARVEATVHGKIYLEDEYGKDPHQKKKDKALLRDLTAAEVYLKFL